MLSHHTIAPVNLHFAIPCQEWRMDKQTLRVERLRELVKGAGGPAKFARQYSQKDADKPIDETYVSQLLNGHRTFGEKAAQSMALRAGLPEDYFDFNGGADPLPKVAQIEHSRDEHPLITAMVKLMNSLDEAGKGVVYGAAITAAQALGANKSQRKSRAGH